MLKLLIVDDETVERRSLRNSVDWGVIGVQVVNDAWNGKQALEMVMQDRPDIILTDVKMPMMDGVQMAKMIRAIDPSIKVIFCSAYEDFDYAREAANLNAFGYLLKPIDDEELLQIVKRASDRCIEERVHHAMYARMKNNMSLSEPLLREAVVRDMLLGMHEEPGSLQEPGSLLGSIGLEWIVETDGLLCLLLASWDAGIGYRAEELRRSLHEITAEWHNSIMIKISSSEIAVVLRSYANPTDTSMLAEHASRQIAARLRQALGARAEVGYGLYSGATSLDEAYADVSRHKGPFGRSASECGMAAGAQADGYALASEAIAKLQAESPKLLHQGNLEALNQLIGRCLEENQAAAPRSLTFYYGIGFSVLSVLIDAIRKQGGAPFSRIDDEISCWTNLMQLPSVPDIGQYLMERAGDFVAKMRGDQIRAEDSFVEQVKNIVANHYQSPLTVEMVANFMHFTPNYVGSVFKAKMKISLNDYIHKYRISQAVALLRDPSLSIHDAAQLCGYENTPYFHKIFKRVTGLTPGEYRLLEEGARDETLD